MTPAYHPLRVARLCAENDRLACWAVGKFLGLYAGADHDDALSEARVALRRAAEAHSAFRGVPFGTYAAFCLERHLRHYWTRVQKRGFKEVGTRKVRVRRLGAPDRDALPVRDDPLARVERADEAERVRAAVGKLPPDLQEVVRRRFFAGESLTNTGAAFGVSKEAARLWQVKALGMLRLALAGEDA